MFPNREQFGRPIGPMGFAVNTPRNAPPPPPPPPIYALPAQHPIHQTPPPPPTQPNPSAIGWTPTHPPPGSFGSPTFPPSPPSTGLSTSTFRHSPTQGAVTAPTSSRPMTPSRTMTPQSLGFHEDMEHWDAKVKYGLKLLKRVASTPYHTHKKQAYQDAPSNRSQPWQSYDMGGAPIGSATCQMDRKCFLSCPNP